MVKHLSDFGRSLSERADTYEMLVEMSTALLQNKDCVLMGLGHPASIPKVNEIWHERLTKIINDPQQFDSFISKYYNSVGKAPFRIALAKLFNDLYGWNLTEKNFAISNGSQTAYFVLFNMLAGTTNGKTKKILFPMVPDYVGYNDIGLNKEMYIGQQALIDITGKHSFKYRLDLDNLKLTEDVSTICVTRPCNPSSNVITDDEVQQLLTLARKNDSYLILDNAYGAPFPNILFKDINPVWNEDIILTYSLSKLGLPNVRTGIFLAEEELAAKFNIATLVISLTVGGIGPAVVTPLFSDKEILRICNDYVRPYYLERCRKAQQLIAKYFPDDVEYYIHEPEGGFFLWLWLKDLPMADIEFFQKLVQSGVLCVPGAYFFRLNQKPWQHSHECLRLSYCLSDEVLERGIKIIGDEIRKVYKK